MAFTISINEEAAFEVLFAGPAGPTGPQGIQGIQGVPGPGVAAGGTTGQVLKKLSSTNYDTGWSSDISGVAWGAITGTLSSQTDLQNALDAKLSISAASSTYLPLAGGYITGDIQSLNGSQFRTFLGANSMVIQSNQIQMGDAVGSLTIDAGGISFNSSPFKQTVPFLGLDGYATEGWVTSNFYPLAGNPSGFLTATALTPYLTSADAALTYYPLTNPDGFISDAPSDNAYYSRRNAGWEQTLGPDAPWDGIVYGRQDGFWIQLGGGVAWGNIAGILSDQADLQDALDQKLDATTAASTYAVIAAGQPVSGTVGQVLTKNSGTNYDSSWATLIPGDRYLTTSTTSLAIDNANKTLTVGTGLSYTPQQDVVIAYDASNHMHAQVLTYNSGTGVMTVDVQSHTGTGTFAVWTVNVGGTVPAASIVWGDITGVLGNQTDLATALNGKLETTTAASTYQTLAGMSSYLTTATAATTYFTIASAAGKANLSGATFTGKVNMAAPTAGSASLNLGVGTAPTTSVAGDIWIATNINFRDSSGTLKTVANTTTSNTFSQPQIIQSPLATTTAALRVTQLGTGNAIQVEDSTTPDATPFVVDQHGKVGIGVAPDATAALKVDTNGIMFGDGTTQTTAATSGIPDCPDDGYLWVRAFGNWSGPYHNQSFVVDGTTYYALVLVYP